MTQRLFALVATLLGAMTVLSIAGTRMALSAAAASSNPSAGAARFSESAAALRVPVATPRGACQGSGCPCHQTAPPTFLRAWGRDPSDPDQLVSPSGMAVAPDGTVYVVDATGIRVAYFDADGTFLGQRGMAGSGDGGFTSPTSVAVAPDGQTVYVTDSGNQRVQSFDATCGYLGQWAGRDSGEARLGIPLGVTVGPGGTVYVTDDYANTVKFFDPAGTYLGQWGSESRAGSTGDGEFWHPYDVAVAPGGMLVYVADTNNHRIQAFAVAPCGAGGSPRGTPVSRTPRAPSQEARLTAAANGQIPSPRS